MRNNFNLDNDTKNELLLEIVKKISEIDQKYNSILKTHQETKKSSMKKLNSFDSKVSNNTHNTNPVIKKSSNFSKDSKVNPNLLRSDAGLSSEFGERYRKVRISFSQNNDPITETDSVVSHDDISKKVNEDINSFKNNVI